MKYPFWFILSITGVLSLLFVAFVVNLHMGSWGIFLIPTDSPIRQAADDLDTYINYGVKSSIEVFMQTKSSGGVRSPDFLVELDTISSQLESLSSVVGVQNMIRLQLPSTTLAAYQAMYKYN
jgi:predicted RND superfamily exporter protein